MFWEFITIFGSVTFWASAGVIALIFSFLMPKKSKKYVLWFIFLTLPAVLISYTVTDTLKTFFQIPRPCFGLLYCPEGYSFPSNHATVVFAATIALALHYKDKRLGVILIAIAILTSLSRVMLGVHRFEDIIFGSIIGIVFGILIQKIYKNYFIK